MTPEDVDKLLRALEGIADELSQINASMERFMDSVLAQLPSGNEERYAIRTLPLGD
jgi:hypothetical protein